MKCRGKTSAGSSCKANAMSASNYCFTHNPVTREQHRAATRKGGAVSPSKAVETTVLPKVELNSVQSVVDVLADAINRVRVVRPDGSMDVKSANTLGFLCGKYAEVYKLANLEGRIKDFEEGKNWGFSDLVREAHKVLDEEEKDIKELAHVRTN